MKPDAPAPISTQHRTPHRPQSALRPQRHFLHPCFISLLTFICVHLWQNNPLQADPPAPLLHISFDQGRAADIAAGDPLPTQGRYPILDFTAGGGEIVPGRFGNALTGGRQLGFPDARGNLLAQRGTLAFFLKYRNKPYGFEPLVVSSVDELYWIRYLRLELKPGGGLVFSVANEVYRPQTLGPGKDAPTLSEDQWHHIALTWDETLGLAVFVDGQPYSKFNEPRPWFARVADVDCLWLRPDADVAYDELYVFDRVLTSTQIANLAHDNRAPSVSELPAVTFDDAAIQQRRRDLGWDVPQAQRPHLLLNAPDPHANAVRQVLPTQARAVRNECNDVRNGKLGSGWPATYGYRYNRGNGLHVELPEPVDLMVLEGDFAGGIWPGPTLDRPTTVPLAQLRCEQFVTHWRPKSSLPAGWISVFRDDAQSGLDASSVDDASRSGRVNRINEISCYRFTAEGLTGAAAQRWTLGQLAEADATTAAQRELLARCAQGDRAVFACTVPDAPAEWNTLPALRYHHLLLPTGAADRPLSALLLDLQVRCRQTNPLLRVELRDPQLPSRRWFAFDAQLENPQPGQPARLTLPLDVVDRIVPAGGAVWLSLVFSHEVELAGSIAWLTGDVAQAQRQQLAMDLPLVLSRFALLSSPRPWGAVADPAVELPKHYKLTAEMFYPLAALRHFAPDEPTSKAIWAWTQKDYVDEAPITPAVVPGHADAPDWALRQRELLRGCRAVYDWWIENRQAPSGEFGDDLNDDTDFAQDFAKYHLTMPGDGRYLRSAAAVLHACEQFGVLTEGLTTLPTDPLHAYENGTNMLPMLALMDWANPAWVLRNAQATRTVLEKLTARDVHGRLRFRSTYYGYNEVRDQGSSGQDAFGNALFVHPALLLSYFNRQPTALQFVTDYAGGWCAYLDDVRAAGRKDFPAATRLDGSITRYDRRLRGFGFSSLFVGAFHLTGDERFRQATYGFGDPQLGHFRLNDTIATLDVVERDKYRQQLLTWSDSADLKHVTTDRFGHNARQRYLRFELTGEDEPALAALDASLRNIRLLFDAYTRGEPQNDRIWPPDAVATFMLLGEIPDERNQIYPRHFVSYAGFSDFAGWVREKSDTHLKLWLYSFAPAAEQGTLRTWRTPLGAYDVRVGAAAPQRLTLHRAAGIPITLEPGQLVEVEITLNKLSEEDFFTRADPALNGEQSSWIDARTVEASVVNLGQTPARGVTLQALDDQGKVLAQQALAELPPATGLNYHPQQVRLKLPAPAPRVMLQLVCDNQQPQMYGDNDRISLSRESIEHP